MSACVTFKCVALVTETTWEAILILLWWQPICGLMLLYRLNQRATECLLHSRWLLLLILESKVGLTRLFDLFDIFSLDAMLIAQVLIDHVWHVFHHDL